MVIWMIGIVVIFLAWCIFDLDDTLAEVLRQLREIREKLGEEEGG